MVTQLSEYFIAGPSVQTIDAPRHLCVVGEEIKHRLDNSIGAVVVENTLRRTFVDDDETYDESPLPPREEIRLGSTAMENCFVPRDHRTYAERMTRN